MLDVHAPHETVHTWRDFLIHIATIVVGLLIAIALEQTVELIHHHDQVVALTEELQVEANNNLPLIRESISRLDVQIAYVTALQRALQDGKVSGLNVEVTGVTPPGSSILYVSPSRATWSSAQTAGIAALLPPGPAKVYARLDYNAIGEVGAEDFMIQQLQLLTDESLSANYDSANPGASTITILHRDNLLFRLGSLENAIQLMIIRLTILEGGYKAAVAGAQSLDEVFRYQNAAIGGLHLTGSVTSFYGAVFKENYTNHPEPAGSNQ